MKEKLAVTMAASWMGACDNLISLRIAEGCCFSSGEITRAIRVHRPDMAFHAPALGAYVRDLFYGEAFPCYADGAPVTQVTRFTEGLFPDRTQAGLEVFVYGPDVGACMAHPFEVFVPRWDPTTGKMETTDGVMPATQGTVPEAASQAAYAATIISGAPSKLKPTDYHVYVRPDLSREPRMYLGRPLFEALCHMSGTPIRAGDPIYVKVSPKEVRITLTDPGDGARPVNISPHKGSVLFSSGDKNNPFPAGQYLPAVITQSAITVPLG